MKAKQAKLIDLFKFALEYKKYFLLGFIGLLGGSIINLLLPALLRYLIKIDYSYYILKNPLITSCILFLCFAIQCSFFYLRSYYFIIFGSQASATLKTKLFSKLVSRPIWFFDQNNSSDLVSRLSSDCSIIQNTISFKLSTFIRHGFQVLVGIFAMCWLSPKLAIASLFIIPILALVGFGFVKKLKLYSKQIQESISQSAGIAEEIFSQIQTVKAFIREKFEVSRFSKSVTNSNNLNKNRAKVSAIFSSVMSFLLYCFLVALVLFGISLVNSANLAVADLTAFILYGIIVAVSFSLFINSYSETIQALGALDRIYEFMDYQESQKPQKQLAISFGDVTFNQVTFAYPERKTQTVLNNLSFVLPSGETTAIVGPSGSGKSTIVKLLLGFYKPKSGTIKIGENNLEDLNPKELYAQIAYVPQEPNLFSVSIRENLLYGKENASMGEIEKACSQANILDFIYSLPNGFETICSNTGNLLSTGQKQRLAIARAILRNPQILILDEATAALDSENETLIQEALARLMNNRTVLVIAHRLTTVRKSKQVLVLNQGQIIQAGKHEDLMSVPGLYAELVNKQTLLKAAND